MQPSLYRNKEMIMSWKELTKQEIVYLENGVLTSNYIPNAINYNPF